MLSSANSTMRYPAWRLTQSPELRHRLQIQRDAAVGGATIGNARGIASEQLDINKDAL